MMGSISTSLRGIATNRREWNAFRFLCAVGVGGE
jgi:hypothetical protein